MLVVDVVVRDDGHLQARQGAIGRAAYAAAELVFGDLAGRVELLAVHELGDLVVVVRDRVDDIARNLSRIRDRREDARLGDQARAAALAAAGDGQVARHRLEQHRHRGGVIAQVALGDAVHLLQVHGLHGSVVSRELADGLGGDAGDGLGPLGVVHDAVDLACDVLAPLLEAVRLDPFLDVGMVVEVLGVEDMGHGQAERGVGARANGDPLRT